MADRFIIRDSQIRVPSNEVNYKWMMGYPNTSSPCNISIGNDNLKIPFVTSTYNPQLIEHVQETYYGPYSVTPGGVPNTNHSSYLSQDYQTRWLTPKRSIFMDPSVRATTRTLTLATLTNLSHNSRNSRFHPSSRSTTQGMSF
ncbi:hypothetical protein DEO72_LG9g1209 [Vigna unguiculata]|uniref:Uncharacterized protein n=1 Tax=Vigna unguiculata TaxID=3917 RepID=A0A4D6MYU0_VIGUN|nr:hypothetical protein DEO72_LG9g1209 [Vigna unguiculata]